MQCQQKILSNKNLMKTPSHAGTLANPNTLAEFLTDTKKPINGELDSFRTTDITPNTLYPSFIKHQPNFYFSRYVSHSVNDHFVTRLKLLAPSDVPNVATGQLTLLAQASSDNRDIQSAIVKLADS